MIICDFLQFDNRIMLLYLMSALVAIATFLYWFCTRNLNYWRKRNVPQADPVPFFGNLKESALRRRHQAHVILDIYNKFKLEKVVGIYRMTQPSLLIKDLDLVKDIMIKNFDAFPDRGLEYSKEGLGANLLHADEETWRLLRNRFSPIFTSGKIKNMFHLLDERSDIFIDSLKADSSKVVEYDIKSIINKYTTSTISACAFGVDVDLNDHKNLKQLSYIEDKSFALTYFIELDQLFPGLLKSLNLSFFPSDLNSFFKDLVKNIYTQRNGKPSGRKDFMDLILELQENGEIKGKDNKEQCLKITENIVAAQAFIFYAGGYETSATTMTYLLYQLAKDQKIQDKLRTEVDEVTSRHGGKFTYESLSEMTYLNKVFDETLRMYPILDTLQRRANRDYQLPGTEVVVPKGQIVLIPVIGIHHDERYYPNPEIFDPERFSAENVGKMHPCAYLPFGTGPRNCIGMRFGKLQSAICIAKLMFHFRIEPSSKTATELETDTYRMVYGPKGGVYMNFIQRN